MEDSDIEEKIDSKYKIIEKIGSGGQANIFSVVKIGTNEIYAAKVFKYKSDSIDNEINMLQEVKQYQCPYIINIIDSGEGEVIRKNRKTKERKYFILENQPNGDIFDYICAKKQGVGELASKIIFQKILFGLKCLHKHNICHRDLKLENILFDENFEPKICDFGIACINSSELKYDGGTKEYLPPEAKTSSRYDGIKGDIFYLASILMILTTGVTAFDKVSPLFKDLFIKIVAYNPDNRLNIDEILAHPWFKEIDDMKTNNLEEFKKNEEKIKELFTSLIPEAKNLLEEDLKKKNAESEYAYYNKSVSDNNGVFNSNVKPKIVDTPMNIRYCINIRGELEPISFMNKLYEEIKNESRIACNIHTDPEILKINITFENILEKEEDEEEIKEEKKQENEDDKEEDFNNELEMEIKLYQAPEKYILRFKHKKGNRKKFIDNYQIISEVAIKLLK